MPLKKTFFMIATLVAILTSAALTANADIVIATGNNPQLDENVLLNTGFSGNPIFGTTNQTGFFVRFSSNETLTAPANGQARVEALDGTLTNLTIDIPGATFTSLILNIDAAADGTVNFVVTEDNGQQTAGSFALTGSGNNFFTITAINGQRIQSVAFTTNVNMSITNLDDVAQVRIGGAQQAPIPEPGTMLLLGTGIMGLAGAMRRRLKK